MLSITEAQKKQVSLPNNHLGFTITESCSVGCRHCAPDCTPKQDSAISLTKKLVNYISASKQKKFPSLVIVSGGEPFERLHALKLLSRSLNTLGIPLQIHTSANWAKDQKSTNMILKTISPVKEITISLDQYHQENIPFQNISRLISTCKLKDIKVSLAIRMWDINKDPFWEEIIESIPSELLEYCEYDIHSIILGGRASLALKKEEEIKRGTMIKTTSHYKISETTPLSAQEYSWKDNSIPCDRCFRPIVRSNGSVTACCNEKASEVCNELVVGNLFTGETIDELTNKLYKNKKFQTIRDKGPLALLMEQEASVQDIIFEEISKRHSDLKQENINCAICTYTLALSGYLENNNQGNLS